MSIEFQPIPVPSDRYRIIVPGKATIGFVTRYGGPYIADLISIDAGEPGEHFEGMTLGDIQAAVEDSDAYLDAIGEDTIGEDTIEEDMIDE